MIYKKEWLKITSGGKLEVFYMLYKSFLQRKSGIQLSVKMPEHPMKTILAVFFMIYFSNLKYLILTA